MINTNNQRVRLQIVLLFAVSILPAVAGWFLYHYRAHFQFKTQNHGTLVNPAIYSRDLVLDGPAKPTWQIVYATTTCDAQTEKTFFILHQVQKALGKDSERVSLTMVNQQTCQFMQHVAARQLLVKPAQYADLQQAVKNNPVYLVDPLGNIFMSYASDVDPMNILKDLKYILGVSQLG